MLKHMGQDTERDRQILDSKRHIMDKNSQTENGIDTLYGNDQNESQYFSYVSKKTEKLSSAVYVLTDFLSDSEPIKQRLRVAVITLLTDVHSLKHLALSDRKRVAKEAVDTMGSILSLFEVAASVHLISRMNTGVLAQEYTALAEVLRDRLFAPQEGLRLSHDYFKSSLDDVPQGSSMREQELAGDREDISQRHYGKDIKDTKIAQLNDPAHHQNGYEPHGESRYGIKDNYKIKEPVSVRQELEDTKSKNKSEERFSRRTQILNFVKDNKQVMIKDICGKLRDVGEKTVQRELGALISAGLIKKTGERRWSRYSLR